MSPLLVIAYAIAGTVAIDFTSEPLGNSFQCLLNIQLWIFGENRSRYISERPLIDYIKEMPCYSEL